MASCNCNSALANLAVAGMTPSAFKGCLGLQHFRKQFMAQVTSPQPAAETNSAAPVMPTEAPASTGEPRVIALPEGVKPYKILWAYFIGIPAIHILSLLALSPWFFSWSGVFLIIFGHYLFGLFGVTLGYHRLLAHKGFTCPKWFEYTLATLGICCLQDSPARWVAIHRKHHQYSDEQPDPHTPLVNFLWSHIGWLMFENRELSKMQFYEHYCRDLLRERYYFWLEMSHGWVVIYLVHAALYVIAGIAVGWTSSGDYWKGVQLGMSWLVWGVFVRTIAVWHVTWAVNSLTHVWGYRNYETGDSSRNNWLVGLLSHGEGWHNNHHAEQRAAAHGHRWWEFDMTYQIVRFLELIGIAKNVVRPKGV